MSASDEHVSQFMSVTGSADPSQAAQYLEMSGGNLETAVGLYMEHNVSGGGGVVGGGGLGEAAGIPGDPMGGGAAAGLMGSAHEVRAPDETRTMRLMDDVDVGPHPAYQLMNAMMDEQLAQSAFAESPMGRNARDVINAAAAAAADRTMDDDDSAEEKDNTDDDDDDLEVIGTSAPPAPARLSDMFAPPDHLLHKAGGFQGARTVAKDSKRWLLVNLQKDSEFSCHALNRDVWHDELVENLIREGFIFWQAMDVSTEGRTYAERYQVQNYPHLGIIDPRTGRLLWRKEGWTQENPMTAETFAEIAMDFCSRNSFDRPPTAPRPPSAQNGAAAARPTKRAMHEMTEDEQLQAAMRASLGDDKDEVMANGDDDDDDDEVQILEGGHVKPAATVTKDETPSFIGEMLAFEVGDEPEKGSRIQLRLPDGKRKIRKFKTTDTVKHIYAYLAQTVEEASSGREFVLMAGFPPKDLIADIGSTIESCKLAGEAITMRWK